jgi:4-hydroxybenzoate polyprenyltransferase
MAFAAVNNEIPAIAWWLLLANVFWSIAYDTEYAIVDRDDDIKIGIKSAALFFGRYDVLAIMLCYVAMLVILAYVGQLLALGLNYYIGIVAAGALVVWQYQMIRKRNQSNCFKAFLANNWIGFVVLLGLAAEYYL